MSAHVGHVTKDGDFRARVVATLLLGGAGIGVWMPVLGPGVLWGAVVLAFSASIVARGPAPRSSRHQLALAAAWPAWIAIAILLAGLPASALSPGGLPGTAESLWEALRTLRVATDDDPWALGAWLSLCGGSWLFAGIQASRPQRASVALAFFMLCVPFLMALLVRRVPDAPWQGAVAVVAGLLWATRSELRAALPAIAAVGLVAVVVSALVGPSEPRLNPGRFGSASNAARSVLSTQQSYAPLEGGFSGQTMFEVRADAPALWRMQVLEEFDGRGWTSGGSADPLPQPDAPLTKTVVTLRGLGDRRVVAPGRVVSVNGPRPTVRTEGESRSFDRFPGGSGTRYTTNSEVVAASPAAIDGVQVPRGAEYERYNELAWMRPVAPGVPLTSLTSRLDPSSNWGQVFRMAESLADGADSQLEIVQRVQGLLVGSGRYRYALSGFPASDPDPLLTFLTSSRTGYCQHFAGAAALLLRIAGVPTRVAIGFGTGEPTEDGYRVRDSDAHAWIEVYFPGSGWVPFNPTPASAEVRIDGLSDTPESQEAPARASGGSSTAGMIALAVIAGVALLVALWHRLRRPRTADPLGEVLVRLVPTPTGPDRTLSELEADLREVGPTVAALAAAAEQQRFGRAGAPAERHPRRRVLRALVKDIGPWRTAALLVLGPGRRPVVDEATAAIAAASVAPPSSSAPPPGRA